MHSLVRALVCCLFCLLLGGLGLTATYALFVQLSMGSLWKAEPGSLQRFYAARPDHTNVRPRDAYKAIYNIIWRNCAAFPAWIFTRPLQCDGLGYMHPYHCRAEARSSEATSPAAKDLMLQWLLVAPELPQRGGEGMPGLEHNLERFLIMAQNRNEVVRVVIASVWISPAYFPLQHLTTLLISPSSVLSLGVDTEGSSLWKLLFGRVPYRLRSPDATVMRSRYRHCRVLTDYEMLPGESAEMHRRLREDWSPA